MGIRIFILFGNQCHSSFREGLYCFDADLQEIDCDGAGDDFNISAYFGWQAGPGLTALGVATFAKVLDLLCNIILPTPSITRSMKEQADYDKLTDPTSTSKAEDGEEDEMNGEEPC